MNVETYTNNAQKTFKLCKKWCVDKATEKSGIYILDY